MGWDGMGWNDSNICRISFYYFDDSFIPSEVMCANYFVCKIRGNYVQLSIISWSKSGIVAHDKIIMYILTVTHSISIFSK